MKRTGTTTQISVSLPTSLYNVVKQHAAHDKRSLSNFITNELSRLISTEDDHNEEDEQQEKKESPFD